MARRLTYRRYDYYAKCQDCDWSSYARNAQGNAAKHSDHYEHTVSVEVTGGVTYTPEGSPWHLGKEATDAALAARMPK